MNKSQEIDREPYTPQAVIEEVEQTFMFNNTPTPDQIKLCQHIESWCKATAIEIASLVPESKEQTIAINGVLSAAVWCRHAICRQPTIEFIETGPTPEAHLSPASSPPCDCGCAGTPTEPPR